MADGREVCAGSIPVCITLCRAFLSTGSRTHPLLYAISRYAVWSINHSA